MPYFAGKPHTYDNLVARQDGLIVASNISEYEKQIFNKKTYDEKVAEINKG